MAKLSSYPLSFNLQLPSGLNVHFAEEEHGLAGLRIWSSPLCMYKPMADRLGPVTGPLGGQQLGPSNWRYNTLEDCAMQCVIYHNTTLALADRYRHIAGWTV